MKPIERPDPYSFNDKNGEFDDDAFHKWFSAKVEPLNKLLESAIEVQGHKEDNDEWYMFSMDYGNKRKQRGCGHTHTALLLNVEGIEVESADDLLFDIAVNDITMKEIKERAKIIRGSKGRQEDKDLNKIINDTNEVF